MTVWNAIYRASLILLGVLVLFGVAAAYYRPMKTSENLKTSIRQLEQDVQKRQGQLEDLKKRQDRLQNDPRFVEKMAREEFGYCKTGETVFKFDGPASAR